jgi:hypothetical protein
VEEAVETSSGPVRSPFLVVILSWFTLGIYYHVWFYQVNDELRRHTPNRNIEPIVRLLIAMFVPIYGLVVLCGHVSRDIRELQRARGVPEAGLMTTGWPLYFFSLLTFGIAYPFIVQGGLNQAWLMGQRGDGAMGR